MADMSAAESQRDFSSWMIPAKTKAEAAEAAPAATAEAGSVLQKSTNEHSAIRTTTSRSFFEPSTDKAPVDSIRCCCGQIGCDVLRHNCTVLESVEKDVQTAAKLGQTLLERHEAYMADAERDRAELISRIGQLEMDKKELAAENARKIEENQALLDQLATLNTTVAESDTRITMLEATLQSSQHIIRRLEGAAERAETMERHLAALEAEQAVLQTTLFDTESEARSAVQRWKRAERGIADLQNQLEKMEKEAREERERHAEVMDRMERQRAVEKELDTAAGRLKGAAAAKTLHDGKTGTAGGSDGVVSHFVRDLLQDNACLQLGMAELRDMLMASNDEIQQLREQLMFHQPLAETNASAASTLRAELGGIAGVLADDVLHTTEPSLEVPSEAAPQDTIASTQPTTVSSNLPPATSHHHASSPSQEFHIHHHYHVSTKKVEPKRAKKKRLSLTPGVFTPPVTVPTTPVARSLKLYNPHAQFQNHSMQTDMASCSPGMEGPYRRSASSMSLSSRHINRDSVSTALSGPSNRWSVFSDPPSEFAMSSVPSSPRTNANTSVFDRLGMNDLSRPVSPTTSVDLTSPMWRQPNSSSSCDVPAMDAVVCGFPPPLTLPPAADDASEQQPQRPCLIPQDKDKAGDDGDGELDQFCCQDDVAQSDCGTIPSADSVASPVSSKPVPPQEGSVVNNHEEPSFADVIAAASVGRPRPLHRAVSHESIVSLRGGLDIHTLKTRPSQLALRPLGAAVADISISSITASPVLARAAQDASRSNAMLRGNLSLGGLPTPRVSRIVSTPLPGAPSPALLSVGGLSSPSAAESLSAFRSVSASASVSASTPSPARSSASAALASAALTGTRPFGRFSAWRPWGGGNNPLPQTPEAEPTPPQRSIEAMPEAVASLAVAPAAATAAAAATPAAAKGRLIPRPITPEVMKPAVPVVTKLATPVVIEPASQTGSKPTTPRPRASASAASPGSSLATSPASPTSPRASKNALEAMLRAPGINQPGVIPGFLEYWTAQPRRGAPSRVHPQRIDHDALQEVLEET